MAWANNLKSRGPVVGWEIVASRAKQVIANIRAAVSQSADLIRISNSANVKKIYVNSSLVLKVNGITNESGAADFSAGTISLPTSTTLPENLIRYATVNLTNAQVLALRATPIEVIAQPGAGKFIEVLSGVLVFDRTAAYTESADNLQLKYVDGSGSAASNTIETTGFLDAAGDAIIKFGPAANDALFTAAGELSNAKVVIHNTGDGEYGGGNAANVVRVKVAYRVHTTSL